MKLDVVFVCQQGELEVMSSLLAASLRHFCDQDVYLHAMTPLPLEEYGTVSPAVRKLLDDLGVIWYEIRNPISDEYKIFNKLNAFNIQPRGDRILFLDSDIVIRRPLQALQAYFSRPFAAKSGNKQRFAAEEEDWRAAYQLFDLPVPDIRWPGSDSHQWGPPYFNAGVMLVDPALHFSELWIDTCRRIHLEERIKMKNRGTVQVGLPVALYRGNIPYALLDQRFNFGLSKGWVQTRRPWWDEAVHIVHYFNPKTLSLDPVIHREVYELVHHYRLRDICALSRGGQKILKSFKPLERRDARATIPRPRKTLISFASANGQAAEMKNRSDGRRLVITGIPQSGASLLASLLGECPGVKLSADVVQAQECRSGSGSPTDVAVVAENTIGGLPRLEQIVASRPDTPVLIVVRDPLATIAEWKKTPALRDADIATLLRSAGLEAAQLSEECREQLAELERLPDLAMKRAGLWDFFATLTDSTSDQVRVLRYEDLVQQPDAVLKYVLQMLFPDRECALPGVGRVRDRNSAARAMLSAWEQECIRTICANNAGKFGYQLYES